MPDINGWLGAIGNGLANLPVTQRPTLAELAWRRIQDKPLSVAFLTTVDVGLPAQTVRIDWDNSVSGAESAAGLTSIRGLVIFGVRDHATVPDTDIKAGYTFIYENREYRLLDPILVPGEIQCRAEAV